jgi:hypothetical protein
VVHRDVKPSNIMLVTGGGRRNAVILDFGISAHSSEDLTRLTVTGEWVGTPNYAPPEQISGHPPSPRSDLYSWALVFVECMTGKPVVKGNTVPATLWQHLSPDQVRYRTVSATGVMRELESCSLDELAAGLHEGERVTGSEVDANETLTIGDGPVAGVATVYCEILPRGQSEDPDAISYMTIALQDRAKVIAQQFRGQLMGNAGQRLELQFEGTRTMEYAARRAARAAQHLVGSLHGRALQIGREAPLRLDVRAGVHHAPQAQAAGARAIAATLCMRAAPGRVLISDVVRELIWRHFACHRAGTIETASGPVTAFSLDAEAGGQRSDASRKRAAMVGRTHELALLRERWQNTRDGDGQIVLLTGEPGVGKSRLLAELEQAIAGDLHRRLICRCVPESQASALAPITEQH